MRNISSNGLAKLTTQYGIEPICIVEVDWHNNSYTTAPDGEIIPSGKSLTAVYADRDIPGPPAIPGKIVNLGALDDVVDLVLSNGSSAQIEITLDDTDGSIKTLYNQYDFHKQDVRVYQWFNGLALSDKFLLFAGKINTPVTWNERDRTVKITVLTHLEDIEVGFSPEEGEFTWLPSAMCGKAWPMIFGTVQDCPAAQITKLVQAITITPVGIPSGSDAYLAAPLYANGTNVDQKARAGMFQITVQMNVLMEAADCWLMAPDGGPGSDAWAKSQELLDQWSKLYSQLIAQERKIQSKEQCITLNRKGAVEYMETHGLGPNPVQTLGGEDFPQNTPLWVNIGGGSFFGHFEGNLFYVSERVNLDDAVQLATDLHTYQVGQCSAAQNGGPPTVSEYNYTQSVPIGSICDGQDAMFATSIDGGGFTIPNQSNVKALQPGQMRAYGTVTTGHSTAGIMTAGLGLGQLPAASTWLRLFWKEGGQTVTLETAEPVSYVVSIVPGTVLTVKAFKQYDGPHVLTTVPTDFYTVSNQQFGPIHAVVLTMKRQLSTYRYPDGSNQGWSNEIYVTFQSSVGPNTVDVMKYLIDTYTALEWDASTFNYVHTKLIQFPSNFALLDKKNVVDVLHEIAFQCRCALWLQDNVFYLRYLPEEPVSLGDPAWASTPQNRVVETITVSDIDAESGVEIGYTPTESLVTKMKIKWRISLAPDNPYPSDAEKHEQQLILRHNIAQYGTHEKSFDWYIYNQPDIIFKCATFWLIRMSTTWKTLKFRTFLNKLNIETLDTILFDDGGRHYAADAPIKALVRKAAYNSAEDAIDFEVDLPVKAGSLKYYPFYWPSKLAKSVTWPPADEIVNNNAGGGGIGVWATGDLPTGVLNGQISGDTIFVGGPNVVYGPNSDRGDTTPTDVGFTAQSTYRPNSITTNPTTTRPYINTGISFLNEEQPINGAVFDTDSGTIDLYKTTIVDSKTSKEYPKKIGHLGDFFNINKEGGLRLELAVAQLVDNSEGEMQVGTSGKDARLSDVLTVKPTPGDVNAQGRSEIVMLDATGAGIYATTDETPEGAEIDFKYDQDEDKVGIATAFLQVD